MALSRACCTCQGFKREILLFALKNACFPRSFQQLERMSISTGLLQDQVEESITEKLKKHFQPQYLDVINESPMHNVAKGSASHFRVTIVSQAFDNKTLVQRHRMVNEVLKDELKGPIHALSIQAISPAQQKELASQRKKSPPCKGGMGL